MRRLEENTMTNEISRRTMLGMAAGAATAAFPATKWIFALNGKGSVIRAATNEAQAWAPVVFTADQAEAVALLADTIIPRTETVGARDARVHEYIDVVLSGRYETDRRRFLRGLNWLEGRCSALYSTDISGLDESQRVELLESISDEHDSHPKELEAGASFFRELKDMTIRGYYTSREGRVEELGLPDSPRMEQWRGCTHSGDDHKA